jgi:ATP-binding protein involved in chromosome partitioning
VPALPVPLAIHRSDEELVITWADDHRASYPARYLRLRCRCAQCEEEMTGRAILDPATVPEDVIPVRIALMGSYAIRIDWSDGHDTGIYTFEYLKKICPCPQCRER